MENIYSNESKFQSKYYKINSSKNPRKNKFIFRQDDDIVQEITIGPENIGKKRNIKFNSIENTQVLYNNIFNNYPSSFVAKKEKNNIPKNEKMVTEYLTKLYDDQHLSKSIFRKKTAKLKNPNQKVSFENPTNSKTKQNLNCLKINKGLFKKDSDIFNKSNILNNNDFLGEQCYGYDKTYVPEIIDSNILMLKSEIITKNQNFSSKDVRRKQTSKTIRANNKKIVNLNQIRNPNRKNTTNNTNFEFYIKTKKNLSSKSNNKRLKSKTLKDKNNKDMNYDKIININNNININNDIKKNNTKKSKKKQDADNIEKAIQKEVKDNMKKKQFCSCFPFLVCLKLKNDEENEKIL